MSSKIFKILLLFFVLICNFTAKSQNSLDPVNIKSNIDTNNVLIGDHIKYSIELQFPVKYNVTLPSIGDTIGKIEIISRSKIDTINQSDKVLFKFNYTLTCFDSGNYEIPPFTVMYEKPGFNTLYPISTNSHFLKFRGITVDTTLAIKDIKPPIEVEIDWFMYLAWAIIFSGAMLLFIILIEYFNKKPVKEKKDQDFDPKIPAHIVAIAALRKLEDEKLWQNGEYKKYYIELTDILRTYLERRFSMLALEETSDMIISDLRFRYNNVDMINSIDKMLKISDLVKFAKYVPIPSENMESMKIAIEFVENTKIIESQNEKVQ